MTKNTKTNVLNTRASDAVTKAWRTSEKLHSSQMILFSKYFRMFKNEEVDSNYDGLSKIVVPKVFEKIIRGTAVINQAIKKIRVTGQGDEDKESAKYNERLIEFEDRVLNLRKIRKLWIQTARIAGTSYLEVTWDMSKEKEGRPYKGLNVALVPGENIRFNPDHVVGEPFRWAIVESNVPFYEVKKMLKGKDFETQMTDEVKNSSAFGNTDSLLHATKAKGLDTSDETTRMVNIKKYYGPYAKEENGDEEDYVIILANDKVPIKTVKNVYADILDDPIPIFELPIYTVPGEPYAYGDAAAIGGLYTELNDTRQQRMDTVTLNVDPMKIILKAAQIDPAQLIAKRGWVVEANMPNAVTVVHPDMQGVAASVNEERIIQGDIDKVLGIPSFGSKTPVSGDVTTDTATGVNATLQAQDVISNSILDEVKDSLRRVYRTILAYNQTFIDKEFKITVVGEGKEMAEEMSVSKERIQGNLDLDIDVELVGNRLARRAEALAALNIGSRIPGTQMGQLWEDYLETHDKANFEDYYAEPQPTPPEPPKMTISLKTRELSELQTAELYKQIPGVNPVYADPAMTKQGRDIMRGKLPENETEEENKKGDAGVSK
ncbi:MAG: hypothetical protein KAU20_07515 [Nanoarchaeota archaeon]|nr:hypothetical protein [Nanoarchaeota archaeon]